MRGYRWGVIVAIVGLLLQVCGGYPRGRRLKLYLFATTSLISLKTVVDVGGGGERWFHTVIQSPT